MDNFWDHSRLVTSTSNAPSASYTQYGGTCTGVTGKWSGRVKQHGMDPHGLGRWSYTTITGKHGHDVLVVTAYQVCKQSINSVGAQSSYAQQWHLLRQSGDPNPNPRKRFIQDLDTFLEPYHTQGIEILLLGDFNETLGDSAQGLDSIVNKYGLLDLLPYHHGLEDEIETQSRGTKRLDYAFGTPLIAESIVRIGLTPYNFILASDHRGLFIDFRVDSFLGGDPNPLMSPALRGIRSTNPKQCRKYVQAVTDYLASHHVITRAAELDILTTMHGFTRMLQHKWEAIDRDLLRACIHAENLTKNRDRPSWLPSSI